MLGELFALTNQSELQFSVGLGRISDLGAQAWRVIVVNPNARRVEKE